MNMQHDTWCTLCTMTPDHFGPIPEETKPYLSFRQKPYFLRKLRKYSHGFSRPYPSPPDFGRFVNYHFLATFDRKRDFSRNRKETPPFTRPCRLGPPDLASSGQTRIRVIPDPSRCQESARFPGYF